MDNILDPTVTTRDGIQIRTVAAAHAALALILLALFAAANNWYQSSSLILAAVLGVLSGAAAGGIICTLVHEWFHYLGALAARGQYSRPARLALFAFEWDFKRNNRHQFLVMSYAGTLGSLAAIALFAMNIPPATPCSIALLAASVGSLAFAGAIEWPVIARVHGGGDPLGELSRTTPRVVLHSATIGLVALLITAYALA
ncbi:MAG TPA: hypothetical protein DD808_04300 [Halieaceae bacterium]|jgi:hypothetical protein|uniref:hypothetical protein n=1 Tax=Haliea TaxID=475794 RepID=UPI000C59D30C|nr:hypothetical protein [Haliea sp.]HBM84351.1 hypothetical protein [Halieaceae bacterium]MAY93623.1 hypothetical protein [Haliea sp.]MBK41382.1 hypothetical protein [Haliea sp.]MBP70221.1 hypothetical protein [Haliea sp.]HBQ39781.1 hypothetical protein [Halieaceae bacterium]|tara:strand:+ start:76608 stop:77207 length:600 start_codon:yes stop_codon:yes gene_type:complete